MLAINARFTHARNPMTVTAPSASTTAAAAAPAAARPVTALRAAYRDEGWAVVREPLPAAVIDDARRSLDAQIAALQPGQRPEHLVEPHVRAPDWQRWLELCRHPAVVARVAECLGADEVTLMMSHLIVKPAGD